jgi:UDP-2,3-diacylglucosamine pyrophosphatase LpxH
VEIASEKDVDCFVFGHFHTPTQQTLPGGEKFFILGEWSLSGEYLVFDSSDNSLVLRKVVFGA